MIKFINLKCDNCNNFFERNIKHHEQNEKRGRKLKYCNTICLNNGNKKDKIKNKCLNCKQKTTNPKYCTLKCYRDKLKKYMKKIEKCLICDTYLSIRNKSKFCKKCFLRKPKKYGNITLKDWKNKYSLNQYHAKIRGCSRSVYKYSRKDYRCAICNYDKHVDICHITPINQFNLDTKIDDVNNKNNLIALCKNHHWEFDNGYLKIPK